MTARSDLFVPARWRFAASGAVSFIVALLLSVSVVGQAQNSSGEVLGKALYQQSCASCHGANLEGGNAQSLVDAVWQFGSKRSHIARNVKYGIADFSMPAFEEAFSDPQINAILDYIFEQEAAGGAVKPPPPSQLFTLDYELKVDVVADDLEIPWAIAFPDERTALVTERPGSIRKVDLNSLESSTIGGLPEVVHEGQGGLLDVSVDPFDPGSGWVYLSYSHALEGVNGRQRPPAMTRIVRGRIRGNRWVDQQVVYQSPDSLYLETRHHYGSRIVFDREGHLYFSIGDRGRGSDAQDLSRPNGKTHRIGKNGEIPRDNPFLGRPDALETIYTSGNRNPQGLAIHPLTGELWGAEHGPMGGDELNRLLPGRNYGWPVITFGRNYDGGQVSAYRRRAGLEAPALYWKPSIAVCGVEFVTSDRFPLWKNQLLVGALKYEEVRLLDIEGDRVLHQEIILKNAGRVRDVGCGPDGGIYVVLNGPDMVLRLTPVRDLNVDPEEAL